MLPDVFPLLKLAGITDKVGSRIYHFAAAPQGAQRPYITWFVVSGQPYDQISGAPCADFYAVQIDCWSENELEVEALAMAVRMALDAPGVANRLAITQYESGTKLYRVGLEADFIISR
jgi:hypothetical protein